MICPWMLRFLIDDSILKSIHGCCFEWIYFRSKSYPSIRKKVTLGLISHLLLPSSDHCKGNNLSPCLLDRRLDLAISCRWRAAGLDCVISIVRCSLLLSRFFAERLSLRIFSKYQKCARSQLLAQRTSPMSAFLVYILRVVSRCMLMEHEGSFYRSTVLRTFIELAIIRFEATDH